MRFSIISLLFPFTVNALSATTANTIIGTAPYLLLSDGSKLKELDELLGFSMPKRNGGAGNELITAALSKENGGADITAPSGMKFNQILTSLNATVGDSDGDADTIANQILLGTITAEWKEGTKSITGDALDSTLSQCGGPYTLTVKVKDVVAKTTYGKPNETVYKKADNSTEATATYKFIGKDIGICNFKPADMTVNTGKTAAEQKFNTTGYNPDVWEYDSILPLAQRHKGFKRNSGFPTTGFHKAVFSLIGSGTDQSKYRCTTNGTWITLSGSASSTLGQNCTVTYEAATRPNTPVTIDMEYTADNGSSWTKIDSYTLDYTDKDKTKWALPQVTYYLYGNVYGDISASTSFPALDRCRMVVDGGTVGTFPTILQQAAGQNATEKEFRQTYMYRRDELTNTPYANYPELHNDWTKLDKGYFARDVDGTFMGEWGNLDLGYPASEWKLSDYNWFLTSEAFSVRYQFSVSTRVGYVGMTGNYPSSRTVCRG